MYTYIRHRAPRHRGSDTNVFDSSWYWLLVSGTGFWSLLKGHRLVLRGLAAARMTFTQLFRHRFSMIFPSPFSIDFGSILAPNLVPKSFQNP